MAHTKRLTFVGTYTEEILFGTGQVLRGRGKGIYSFFFDEHSGRLTPGVLNEGIPNPSYICFHPTKNLLFAVNEGKSFQGSESGSVSSFNVDTATGALRMISRIATNGTDPCHLSTDASGRLLFVANFASGCVFVAAILEDGGLQGPVDHVIHRGSSRDPVRQSGPHAHAVVVDPGNRYLHVPDLGLDAVKTYRFDLSGHLEETGSFATAPGAGPRQLAFHSFLKTAYLINELDSTVTCCRYHDADGSLHAFQTVSTLPVGCKTASTCAEVQLSSDGRYLLGSNRGHDSVAVFSVSPKDGGLTTIQHLPTGGRTPRNFDLHPSGSWLAAVNQDSHNLLIFRRQEDGRFEPAGTDAEIPTPVCVRFTRWCF